MLIVCINELAQIEVLDATIEKLIFEKRKKKLRRMLDALLLEDCTLKFKTHHCAATDPITAPSSVSLRLEILKTDFRKEKIVSSKKRINLENQAAAKPQNVMYNNVEPEKELK